MKAGAGALVWCRWWYAYERDGVRGCVANGRGVWKVWKESERVGNRCQPKSAAALLLSFVPEEINRTGNLSNANNALFLRFIVRHRTPAVQLFFRFLVVLFFFYMFFFDSTHTKNFVSSSSDLVSLISGSQILPVELCKCPPIHPSPQTTLPTSENTIPK